MNIFKSLDLIFPVGDENRLSGEVVNVDIQVTVGHVELQSIQMKRKAWYVNASVNAFHMHRSLVRDFTETVRDFDLSASQMRNSKRLIVLAVLHSYLLNRQNGSQVQGFSLYIDYRPTNRVNGMFWLKSPSNWIEIRDALSLPLRELVEGAVEDFQLMGEAWHSR